MNIKKVILFLFGIAFCVNIWAIQIHVSLSGDDTNPGTEDQPLKSFQKGQQIARRYAGKESVRVVFHAGTYYLDDTIQMTSQDGGTENHPVIYTAAEGEDVVISGGQALTLNWKQYKGKILQAETPADLSIDQLFVNGIRQCMARYPNFDPNIAVYNGYDRNAFSKKRALNWVGPEGGYIHAMHRHRWGGYHYRITGKDQEGNVTYEGGWQNNRQMGMHKDHRFVENIFEELDAPGEWFHNSKTNILYYYPAKQMDMTNAVIEIVRLRHLIEFVGTQQDPVCYVTLKGLTFAHAARTFMDTKEPLLRSDWMIYRGGAVLFNGAEDCCIVDSVFDQVGGNAIFVNKYNRRIKIQRCHIYGAGASGVAFVGDPEAVRNPLFEYGQKQNYAQIDKDAGPKTNNYPTNCLVDDCLIHQIGVVEKQAAGVQISMSGHITIRHCSIYDVGRAGINISEGTFGGHLIEFCDVFHTVRETSDHGSFNSWGRDRFWHLNDAPEEKLPDLALLDAEKTIIRNSRWHCDHGWDIDLDDGSSNYEIYNNLLLKGGLKLREGFHRKAYNNIIVNNSLHPHAWYPNSQDIFTGNIVMGSYRPAGRMPKGKWGRRMDYNFFAVPAEERDKYLSHGCDEHSIVGDPMFIDPASGDFRVNFDSPALKIGFKNFPMDQFGVQTPTLKSIARTPAIPSLTYSIQMTSDNEISVKTWLGAKIRDLYGQEFSAYGVSKESGGVLLVEMPDDSVVAEAGLRPDDLIQTINGIQIKNVDQLLIQIQKTNNQKIIVEYVREQAKYSTIIVIGNIGSQ